MTAVPLAASLLHAAEWFNTALLTRLTALGWPTLSRSQSQVFPLLDPGGTSQAELARRLGITRQSTHVLIRDLERLGLLERRPSAEDGRVMLVCLDARGAALARDAARILVALEAELADRIGAEPVDALARAMRCDWGPPATADTP